MAEQRNQNLNPSSAWHSKERKKYKQRNQNLNPSSAWQSKERNIRTKMMNKHTYIGALL
jgi:hypothetical protein